MADEPPATARRGSEDAVDDYKVGDKKTIAELLSTEGKESEDEALQRYKASLLGAAAGGGGTSTDPRRVVVTELAILIDGHDPIVVDEAAITKGDVTIQLKEGCSYKTQLTFRVQNDLISGLKYRNVVSRMVTVAKVEEMLGSYAPDPNKTNTIVVPRREWDEAPSGMTARGNYNSKITFTDDDKTEHLSFQYQLTIAKDWKA